MAIQYKSLFDFTQKTSLNSTDRFLVASGSQDNFVTQYTLYGQLSADLHDIIERQTYEIVIVRDKTALNDDNKVASAKITNDILNEISQIKSNYCRYSGDSRDVNSQWTFNRTKIPRINAGLDDYSTVVEQSIPTLQWVKDAINKVPNFPLFTAQFVNLDMNNRTFWLRDILQPDYTPQSITAVIAFATENKSSKFTPTVACFVDDVAQSAIKLRGTTSIKLNDTSKDKLADNVAYQFVVDVGSNKNKIKFKIDNINSTVACSFVVYKNENVF